MSDQNSTTPDPSDAVPGYQPPSTSEPAAATPPAYTPPSAAEPPAYTPPSSTGGYEPPAATPPAYTPPSSTGGYAPPAAGGYAPPASGGYAPPAAGGYAQPPAGGYSAPETGGYSAASGGYSAPAGGGYAAPPSNGGFPEPPGPGSYPSAPGAFNDPNAYPGAGYPGAGYPGVPVVGSGAGAIVDWPKRAYGWLLDYLAPSIVFAIIGSTIGNITNSSGLGQTIDTILGIAWWCYLGYKSGTTGVTFGRSLAKTKLVSAETGQVIGVQNGIIRQFAHIIDSLICGIGWLFPLWDAKRQTIADKIMKTVVIDNSADPNASNYNWQ